MIDTRGEFAVFLKGIFNSGNLWGCILGSRPCNIAGRKSGSKGPVALAGTCVLPAGFQRGSVRSTVRVI